MNRRRSVPARWRRVVALALGVVAASAGRAYAWEPFRSANANVEAGNAALAKGDTAGALTAYDRAARQLPNEAGVHFDRGLALLKKGDTAKAREAFLLATDPTASAEIRAGAYHALGLGFYAEGDALAKENKHVEANQKFREAVEVLKKSLRAQPGNREAAWNLELTRRRILEEQKKEQDEAEKQKQEQKPEDQSPENSDESKSEDDKQDESPDQDDSKQQNPDEAKDDPGADPKKPDGSNGADQPKPPEPADDGAKNPDGSPKQGEPPPNQPPPKDDPQGQKPGEPSPGKAEPPLPARVEKALDALKDSEKSLARHRAEARARYAPRRVEKDW